MLELLQRHFAIVNTKGGGLSGSSSHDESLRTLALAYTCQLLSPVILCAAAHPVSLIFPMSQFCHKVSEPLACDFRSSPASSEGTASEKDSLAEGSCPSCQDKVGEGRGLRDFKVFPVIWQLLIMFQLSQCLQLLHNLVCTCRTPRVSMELHKVKRKKLKLFPKHFKINWLDCGVEVCWAFPKILTISVAQSRVDLQSQHGWSMLHFLKDKRERIISHFAWICSNTGGTWIMVINVETHSGLWFKVFPLWSFPISKRVWCSS